MLDSLIQVDLTDDRATAEWVEQSAQEISTAVSQVRSAYVASKIVNFAETERAGALQGLVAVLSTLSDEDKKVRPSILPFFSPHPGSELTQHSFFTSGSYRQFWCLEFSPLDVSFFFAFHTTRFLDVSSPTHFLFHLVICLSRFFSP